MNRLRECRKNKKLTLKQLSKELAKQKIKISADALGKYERGDREPKLETWLKLAEFFDVPILYLQGISNFTNDDEKEIDSLMPSYKNKDGELNWPVVNKIMNIDGDLKADKEIKREFKNANQIIEMLYHFNQERQDEYKKIISNSKLPADATTDFPHPVGDYMFILEIVTDMFFSAQKGDKVAKNCILEISKLYNQYDAHETEIGHKK